MLLVLPLSLLIVLGGIWLITTQLVKAMNDSHQQAVRVVSAAVAGATEQAVKGAVEAVAALMGPVVPPGEIAAPDVPDSPPWEDWGGDEDGAGFGNDPLDRMEPDPESWRQDAVGVRPGFQFDPREPDLSAERL